MKCLGVDFLGIFPTWCFLSFLDLWFAICHSFWKVPSHSYFKYFFFSILSLWYCNYVHVTSFETVPQFLDVLFSLCFILFLFAFQFGKFLLTYFPSSLILSLATSNLLMSPSEAFLTSVTVFPITSISFWFFLRVSISLLTLSIDYCMLSTFSASTLSILIIVILISWSDNSDICVTGKFNRQVTDEEHTCNI